MKLEDYALKFEYVQASGPGGQNVNKVATAVQLRFDIKASKLTPDVQQRLIRLAGARVTGRGILIIEAKRFRTREKNKEDASKRFLSLVHNASIKPRKRIETSPTRSSREKRLLSKKIRSDIKRNRRNPGME